MDKAGLFTALLVFAFGLFSRLSDRSPVTGPMIFVSMGLLLGPLGLDLFQSKLDSEPVQIIATVTLVVICYALAETLHGNGFIAAFFGGLMLGTRTPSVRERIQNFEEAEGQYLMLFIFLIFGMVMVPVASPHFTGRALLYAVLSLTVIRMVPVTLSLMGSRINWGPVAKGPVLSKRGFFPDQENQCACSRCSNTGQRFADHTRQGRMLPYGVGFSAFVLQLFLWPIFEHLNKT